MREPRDCWVCELPDCGKAWLAKSTVPPAKCGVCRRRRWHLTKPTAELIREAVQPVPPPDRLAAAVTSAAHHLRTPATITTARELVYQRDDYSQD